MIIPDIVQKYRFAIPTERTMDPDLLEIRRRYKRQILDAMRDWPRRPADFHGPPQEGECWSSIPIHPADADVDANMRAAADMWPNPFAFKDAVQNKGRWNYKRRARHYENFGNFNYGATGTAWGFGPDTLKREAGRKQIEDGTSKREWQKPSRAGLLPPYGDDPIDQYWIQRGIDCDKSGGKLGTSCK
jgi:hypothetical protein